MVFSPQAEFMELIKYFEDHKMELDLIKLLMIVDPYNHQQITFSQCVALFSSVKIPSAICFSL